MGPCRCCDVSVLLQAELVACATCNMTGWVLVGRLVGVRLQMQGKPSIQLGILDQRTSRAGQCTDKFLALAWRFLNGQQELRYS